MFTENGIFVNRLGKPAPNSASYTDELRIRRCANNKQYSAAFVHVLPASPRSSATQGTPSELEHFLGLDFCFTGKTASISMLLLSTLRAPTFFSIVVAFALALFLLDYSVISREERNERSNNEHIDALPTREGQRLRRLAVVVPTHSGDLRKAMQSLDKWPKKCHRLTLGNADLILYYAGGKSKRVEAILPSLAASGGKCFANTSIVFANLTKEVSDFTNFLSCNKILHYYLDVAIR